jgi:hypothetical protein
MFANTSRVVALATVLSLSTVAFPAGPAPVARPVTVGDFAVKVARALGYPADDAETAGNQLRMAGVHLDPDLSAPLTEGRASDFMRDLGVDSHVSGDPSSPMSEMAASRAASTLALSVGESAGGISTEGGEIPASCTSVVDRMTCNQCCLGVLLPRVKFPIRAIVICAVLCARVFPPNPSVSVPQQ